MEQITLEIPQKITMINEELGKKHLFPKRGRDIPEDQLTTWRISPEPFCLDKGTYAEIKKLGDKLLSFYRAVNLLYSHSRKGLQPGWVKEYLDRGKHEEVLRYGTMNRFKKDIPPVIRPDIIITEHGPVITELDSVPGGIGLLGAMNRVYSELGYEVVGGKDAMLTGFHQAVAGDSDGLVAVVVSEESKDYLGEMTWLADALREMGYPIVTVNPHDVEFHSREGLLVSFQGKREKVDTVYRFFELFDLRNIPTADLILYAARKGITRLTPPVKAYFEEKLLLALLHHPALRDFWRESLGKEMLNYLRKCIPMTWIMDPAPLPPQAVIHGLRIGGRTVTSWDQLREASKSQREFALKPSGYNELAWGSRGLTVGHDVSTPDWRQAIDRALSNFESRTFVLQKFCTGKRFRVSYYDFARKTMEQMDGRVRLCPYFYVINDHTELAGILATICPPDKKAIHGMTEAVMVPCIVA